MTPVPLELVDIVTVPVMIVPVAGLYSAEVGRVATKVADGLLFWAEASPRRPIKENVTFQCPARTLISLGFGSKPLAMRRSDALLHAICLNGKCLRQYIPMKPPAFGALSTMAPSIVLRPVKGVAVGRTGKTLSLTVLKMETGGSDWKVWGSWALARAKRPPINASLENMFTVVWRE